MAAGVPSDEVLTELGRVTYAAIVLEDLTAAVCHAVKRVDPRTDTRPIGQKIEEALKELQRRSPSDAVGTWLTAARSAIRERNAALHAIPLVVQQAPGADPLPFSHALGEKRKDAPYMERPLSVPALQPLREQLELAAADWYGAWLLAASLEEADTARGEA
jgi:hypothetical protein